MNTSKQTHQKINKDKKNPRKSLAGPHQTSEIKARGQRMSSVSSQKNLKIFTYKKRSAFITSDESTETSENIQEYEEKNNLLKNKVLESLQLFRTVSSNFIKTKEGLENDVLEFKEGISNLKKDLCYVVSEKERSKSEIEKIKELMGRKSLSKNEEIVRKSMKKYENSKVAQNLMALKADMSALMEKIEAKERQGREKSNDLLDFKHETNEMHNTLNDHFVIEGAENLVICKACSIF